MIQELIHKAKYLSEYQILHTLITFEMLYNKTDFHRLRILRPLLVN